ncbi:unnamed protein product [Porites lobata]|uniref:Uncharacterized protein n=1 Tax=Porites lobata TaxID=104759 RepID=A0ABN8N8Y8_9CNID|nr:unnamed protein product [Porites lobata]
MSRSSMSSTQAPSSGLLTRTGSSYEGDIESLALTDSEIENCSVHSVYYSESWPSPAFPIISTGRSSSATLAEESSSLFESEYDTEISSSDTSAVIYTDNDFCRVQRTVGDRRAESAFATEGNKRCKWETDGASDSRINTAHYSAPSLYNAKPIPNEASNLRFSVNADDFSQELYQSNASQQDFDDGHFNEVGSEDKLNTPETTLQESELAEHDIIEKKRFLRKNFSSVLKEARKSVREARGNLSTHEMKLRSKRATSKYPQVREPRLTVKADSNKEGSFENSVKWVVTRPYVNPRSKKFIKQRKKQDAIELERRRAELLIMELKGLNLHEQAGNVKSALAFKDKKEKDYDDQLDAKREDIKKKKSIEACHLKEEMKRKRLEEIRRKEEERKEKEDFERKKRIEEAKIRREKNRMLWESYNAVVLANSVSRSFTFSYFPKLRPQPLERPQTEPQKKSHSENHVDKCHR